MIYIAQVIVFPMRPMTSVRRSFNRNCVIIVVCESKDYRSFNVAIVVRNEAGTIKKVVRSMSKKLLVSIPSLQEENHVLLIYPITLRSW